jgi:Exostosin family
MKVFATTAIKDTMPDVATYVPLFTRLAEQDRFCVHQLVNDPEGADIILFMDGHQHYLDMKLDAIRHHPLVRKHLEKAFVYNEQDQPWCAMPGLYVGMPKKSFNPQRQRACAYLTSPNPYLVTGQDSGRSPDLLFSFMGRNGNQTRERILRQSHPRATIADTSAVDFFASPSEDIERQKQHYADVIARSKFVLCPPGAGPASFRIFETMAAGRVPVILSDSWEAPQGPDWKNCALFINEKQVDGLAGILEKREEHFQEMALAARREWEQWFAPDVLFHRMTEGIGDIVKTRRVPEGVLSRKFDTRYLRLRVRAAKGNFKHALRQFCGTLQTKIQRKPSPSSLFRQ